MFNILSAYGIPSAVVEAIKIMYVDTSALVVTPEGETERFSVNTGVLQGDPLAPFLFVICLDYVLRQAIPDDTGLTLKRRRSSRHPAEVIADLDFADDIALLEDNLLEAEVLLHKVEKASQEIGLFLNAPKTKFIHLNSSSNGVVHALDDSSIDQVEDFKYLGGYTETAHDIAIKVGQAWGAIHALAKVWNSNIKKSTKIQVFLTCVQSILLYSSDSWSLTATLAKSLDGKYTKMLRRIQNISWRSHMTNKSLYGNLPKISAVIRKKRLALAGHVMRHNQPASKLLFWKPEEKRRIGRPRITLLDIIVDETALESNELITAMQDRVVWKNFIMSPTGVG